VVIISKKPIESYFWQGVVPPYRELKKLVSSKETESKKRGSKKKVRIVELGCGTRKYPGSIGVDVKKRRFVDIVWDLEKTPYPFADNSIDMIVCREVIEHLHNTKGFMSEASRILNDKGILYLTTNNRKSLINRLFKTYEKSSHCSLQDIQSLKNLVSRELEIVKFFCLPYSDQDRTDLKYKTFRPFRILLHKTLPQSLQERMVVIATNRTRTKRSQIE